MDLLQYASRKQLIPYRLRRTRRHRRAYFRLEYRDRYPDPTKYF